MAICILYAVHYIYIRLVELDQDCFYSFFFFCGCLGSFLGITEFKSGQIYVECNTQKMYKIN